MKSSYSIQTSSQTVLHSLCIDYPFEQVQTWQRISVKPGSWRYGHVHVVPLMEAPPSSGSPTSQSLVTELFYEE